MNKTLLSILAVMVVVGGGSFYGGMKYAQSARQNFVRQNFSGQESGANIGEFRGRRIGGQAGGSFVNGEIIAKDDKSITIKLREGGSRLIFYSDATEVEKFVSGDKNDLEIGKSVMAGGKANPDGSVTAETIQLRSNPVR